MSITDPPSAPPPGWYRDRPDATGVRWWDGGAWTAHRQDSAPGGRIAQPPLPPGTRTSTLWSWLLALLPALQVLGMQPILRLIDLAMRPMDTGFEPSAATVTRVLTTAFVEYEAFVLLLIALFALGSWLDHRALRRRGIIRPFHWAWGFLTYVYIVGRGVVVARRTGGGLAPTWTAAAVFVAAVILDFVEFGAVVLRAAAVQR